MKKEDPKTRAIDVISRDLSVSSDRVARLYTLVLSRYREQARVVDFLHVLVERRVRILLEKLQTRRRPY